MARRIAVDGLTPVSGVPIEIGDEITLPFVIQTMSIHDAMEIFEEDLLSLNEALVTRAGHQIKMLGNGCKRTMDSFLEVKYRIHDVFGESV